MHQRSVWVAALGGLALIVGCFGGCKKDQESLIVVSVTADAMATDVTSLTLSVAGTTKVFDVPHGLSASASLFGLYVPADVTGQVTIDATASRGTCLGYEGHGGANIPEAGTTTNPASPIRLARALICNSDAGLDGSGTGGGSGGASGSPGTGGLGGSVGTGGVVGAGGMAGVGGIVGTGGAGGAVGTGGKAGAGGIVGAGGGVGMAGAGGKGGPGGMVGTGGSVGTGGAAGGATGSGCASTPAVGTPPQLTCCTELEEPGGCNADAYIRGVAFTPDGKTLVTGGDDRKVTVWTFDGKMLTATSTTLTAPGSFAYGYLAISPDGKYLAVGGDGAISVYSMTTWAPVAPQLKITDTAWGVAFAPDSQHVISMDDATVYVHAIGTATALSTRAIDLYEPEALTVSPVAGPNGSAAIVVAGEDLDAAGYYIAEAEVYSWSSAGGLTAPVRVLTSSAIDDDELFSAAVSADGASLALGDYDAQIWWAGVPTTNVTIPAGSSLTIDPTNYQVVEGVAYSPKNARYLAVAGGVTANYAPGLSRSGTSRRRAPTRRMPGSPRRRSP